MNCKNCGNSISESFCSYCGQRNNVGAINFSALKNEFQSNIFQINRGLLFTVKELFTRPGHAIRDFINGKRKPYYKPLSFLLVCVTIYIFTAYLLGKDSFLANSLNDFNAGWNSAYEDVDKHDLKDNGIIAWLKTNQTYLVFALVPIFALASFIIFLKTKYNYYEHLVLQLYITGQQFVMITVFTLIFFFSDEALIIAILVSSISYSLFTYKQFFKGKTFVNIFLKYILMQVLFLILFSIIAFVVMGVGTIISKLM